MVHIVSEVVVLVGLAFYFNQKNKKLLAHIEDLAQRVEEQEDQILEAWNKDANNPPPLLELIKLVFPDKNVDGRSREGRMVKAFLSSHDLKARGAHEYQHKEIIELTQEQVEFIHNHYPDMATLQIAKVIFDNNELGPLNQETRIVAEYVKNKSIPNCDIIC